MEFNNRPADQRPPEWHPHSLSLSYMPQQVVGASFMGPTDVRHAWGTGLSPAINQIQEQNPFLGAMNNAMRCIPSCCVPNVEVDPALEQNNSLRSIQYDATQRQLEKQRIREEIIASGFMRRRMLEMEVRRELEQEMAMKHHAAAGFYFQERPAAWFDERFSFVDKVDNQLIQEPWASRGRPLVDMFPSRYPLQPFPEATQPLINAEASRSRQIVLAKPTPILSGAKQKLISVPAGESSPKPSSIRIKRPTEENSCALCRVSTTSAKGLDDHLKGKKHKLMEEMLRAKEIEKRKPLNSRFLKGKAATGTGEEDKKSGSMTDGGPKMAPKAETCHDEPNKKRKRSSEFGCDTRTPAGQCSAEPPPNAIKRPRKDHNCALCGVSPPNAKALVGHLQGKKHKLMEDKLRAEKLERQKPTNSELLKGKAVAGSGNVGKEEKDEKCIPHPSKDCKGISSMKDDGPKIAHEPSKNKKGLKFWCELCGVGAYCETVFAAHMKGKKHWLQLEFQREGASKGGK